MTWKRPTWIFLGLFLFAPTSHLGAQQPAPGALSPKQMEEERAKVQLAEKRYDAAIQTYQGLLKNDPKNAVFMNMIGIAYLDLSNYVQARRYFLRATKATGGRLVINVVTAS